MSDSFLRISNIVVEAKLKKIQNGCNNNFFGMFQWRDSEGRGKGGKRRVG